jgi:drug/metabolite transporter (DMT)-like permease
MTRRGWALFAALCLVWGVPYLLIRVAVRDISPGTLVFLRTGIGGLVLVPFALRAGRMRDVLRRWRPILAFAVVEVAVPWVLLGDAERHLSSSLSGLIIAAVPLVGLVAARAVGSPDARGGPVRHLGLALGLVGVGVLLGLDFGSLRPGSLGEMSLVVVGYAVAPMILSRYLSDLPNIPVVCVALLMVATGYLPYAVTAWPRSVSAHAAWSVAGLALVCTTLAFILLFALVGEIGPSRATVITYVNPAVALVLGVLVLDEPFTTGIAIGFPLILLGSVLAAQVGRAGSPPGVPEAAVADAVLAADASPADASPADQSMRTSPLGVSKTAATTPVSPTAGTHSTSMPSSG